MTATTGGITLWWPVSIDSEPLARVATYYLVPAFRDRRCSPRHGFVFVTPPRQQNVLAHFLVEWGTQPLARVSQTTRATIEVHRFFSNTTPQVWEVKTSPKIKLSIE